MTRPVSRRDLAAARPRAAAVARPTPVMQPLRDPWGGPHGPVAQVDAYAENPLLDYLQTASAPPLRGAPAPPEFFNSGPRPPVTASGVDPAVLVRVHWRLRHTAALTPDPSVVLAIIETDPDMVAGDNDPMQSPAGRGALYDYMARMRNWALWTPPDVMTLDEYRVMFGEEKQS